MFSSNSDAAARATFRRDLARGFFDGSLQAGTQTLGLLILISVFRMPDLAVRHGLESVLIGASFFGMMASLAYTHYSGKIGWRRSRLAALPGLAAGALLLAASAAGGPLVYTALIAAAFSILPLRLPMLTAIYHENYPENRRGFYTALALSTAQATAVAALFFSGRLLETDLSTHRWILAALGLCAWGSAASMAGMPSRVHRTPGSDPFSSFRWVKRDRTFRYMLAIWFLFGLANLWILPIRISYLTDSLGLSPARVTLIVGVIPEATRMVFMPLWGRLFDRINFIVMRIALNLFFAAGIALYFTASSIEGIMLGAFLHGLGFAGGRVSWALWVTKFAPKGHSSDYMSVHVALTGIRGALGPYFGYMVLGALAASGANAYRSIGLISAGLILFTVFLLAPMIPMGAPGRKRPAPDPIEPI